LSLSKTQIDRLGERLKRDNPQAEDLILLEQVRLAFGPAYENVARSIRSKLGVELTGRPAKTTKSVIEKLKRETTRLSQIQDIAGCRIVVPVIPEQDQIVEALVAILPSPVVIDRRKAPSYGYRAVHVVPRIDGYPVEIQVRTDLQHRWAQISEKLADIVDPAIKYGGGPEHIKDALAIGSGAIQTMEETEYKLLRLKADDTEGQLKKRFHEQKSAMLDSCQKLIDAFTEAGRQ
jgi:putative GTP pyrophosphokinase